MISNNLGLDPASVFGFMITHQEKILDMVHRWARIQEMKDGTPETAFEMGMAAKEWVSSVLDFYKKEMQPMIEGSGIEKGPGLFYGWEIDGLTGLMEEDYYDNLYTFDEVFVGVSPTSGITNIKLYWKQVVN